MPALQKNTGSQYVYFVLIRASDGTAVTGATVTARVSIDGAAQGAAGGSVTELGNGQYVFAPTAADVNGTFIGFLFTATGAIPVNVNMITQTAIPSRVDVHSVQAIDAAAWAGVLQSVYKGTVGTGPTTTTIVDTGLPDIDDTWWVGRIIIFLSSAGTAYQASKITASVASTHTLTFDTLTRAPSVGDKYVIV